MALLDSATVVANQDATAAQYNNLRHDILTNTGQEVLTTGAADAYIATVDAQLAAGDIVTGTKVRVRFHANNTGASTIRIDDSGGTLLAATAIRKNNDVALEANDLMTGIEYELTYNGTNWRLLTPIANAFTAAQITTLRGGGNADSLHIHTPNVATFAIGSQTVGNETKTQTFIPGFQAAVIHIEYKIQGATSGAFVYIIGHAYFETTTNRGGVQFAVNEAGNVTYIHDRVVLGTNLTAGSLVGVSTTVTLDISSITATQFTIRITGTTHPVNGGLDCVASYQCTAWR